MNTDHALLTLYIPRVAVFLYIGVIFIAVYVRSCQLAAAAAAEGLVGRNRLGSVNTSSGNPSPNHSAQSGGIEHRLGSRSPSPELELRAGDSRKLAGVGTNAPPLLQSSHHNGNNSIPLPKQSASAWIRTDSLAAPIPSNAYSSHPPADDWELEQDENQGRTSEAIPWCCPR